MTDNSKKISVSIFRVDEEIFMKSEFAPPDIGLDLYTSVISYITDSLDKKGIKFHGNRVQEYEIILYAARGRSKWEHFIVDLLVDEVPSETFYTQFPSFFMIKSVGKNVYCITSGLANTIIDPIKDKLFGVNLVPKLIKKDENVIRHITENKMVGRRNQTKNSNKIPSSFVVEQNLESLYSELVILSNQDIQEQLGFNIVKTKDKKNNVIIRFAASVSIAKKMDFHQLDKLLKKINEVHENDSLISFTMQYIAPVDKCGMKQADVSNHFFNILKNNAELLIFPANPAIETVLESCALKDYLGTIIESVTSFDDIRNYIIEKINTGISPKNVLKNTRLINQQPLDHGDYEYPVYDLLGQEIEYQDRQVYLFDGKWYVFIEKYANFLQENYKKLYDDSLNKISQTFKNMNINPKQHKNETMFHNSLEKNVRVLVSDKKQYDRIEIADAFLILDKEIIILHNKSRFNGESLRDLTGQIQASCHFLNDIRMKNDNNAEEIKKYISKVRDCNQNKKETLDSFTSLISNNSTNISYVACFIEEINVHTKSEYIKFLLNQTKILLYTYNYNFYFI